MQSQRVNDLIEQYGKYAPMSLNEASALTTRAFADEPASRDEAESLLCASTLFAAQDFGWRHIVAQEVRRSLLNDTAHDEMQAGAEDWLIVTLTSNQVPDAIQLELIQAIMQCATNTTERLGRLGLRAALTCLQNAPAEALQVEINTA